MWILVYLSLSVQQGIVAMPVSSHNSKQECEVAQSEVQHNIVGTNEQLTCIQLIIAEENT